MSDDGEAEAGIIVPKYECKRFLATCGGEGPEFFATREEAMSYAEEQTEDSSVVMFVYECVGYFHVEPRAKYRDMREPAPGTKP